MMVRFVTAEGQNNSRQKWFLGATRDAEARRSEAGFAFFS
jgi:hypothetical protein